MKKVSLALDNKADIDNLKSILEHLGCKVFVGDEFSSADIVFVDNLQKIPAIRNKIIIFVLEDINLVQECFRCAVADYIVKPFVEPEIKAKINLHLRFIQLKGELEKTADILLNRVQEQVKFISDTQMETIFSLAKLAQSRDDDTGKHLERVQKYCYVLAKALKENSEYSRNISDDFIKNIVNASTLHDIGKVGISDLILLKPGKLTPEEFEIMKTHTIIGYETLEEVDEKFGNNEFITMGKFIARSHHERWDGKGYPDGLEGGNIPLGARIMAIADVYDALSTKRVYKDALPQEKCIEIIKEGSGTQFDPVLVEKFLEVADEFAKIRSELQD